MRSIQLFTCLLVLGISGMELQAVAQAPRDPAAFSNGVAYTFERTFAKRPVNDAYDHGTLTILLMLVSTTCLLWLRPAAVPLWGIRSSLALNVFAIAISIAFQIPIQRAARPNRAVTAPKPAGTGRGMFNGLRT